MALTSSLFSIGDSAYAIVASNIDAVDRRRRSNHQREQSGKPRGRRQRNRCGVYGFDELDGASFVQGLFYTQSASLWDLTPAPRRSLSEEYAFLVDQMVESEALRLSPRLSVRYVRMADLALTDDCLDGVHYTGTHPNGTRTVTASTVARAILAEGHAVLPVSR